MKIIHAAKILNLFFISFTHHLKKTISIFFFTVYLLAITEAHQLLKLPIVFAHFTEHKNEDKSISFLEFLDIHYMQGIKKDKDYERDMELPFKTASNCISVISSDYIPLIKAFSFAEPVKISEKKIYANTNPYILSAYLSNIWQPPKFC